MHFSIKADKYADLIKAKTYFNAKRTILLFPQGPAEVKLDQYLNKEYKTNLKLLCLKILDDAKFSKNNDQEIIVTFRNKQLDNLASLITYGNSELQGSKILKTAFMRK